MKLTKALRFTLIFAVVGIVTTFLVVYIQRNIFYSYEYHQPYLMLANDVKSRSAQAYINLQQLQLGNNLDFQNDIVAPLILVQQTLQDAYDGRQTSSGNFKKSGDEETRAILKESAISIEKLVAVLNENRELYKAGIADSSRLEKMKEVNQQVQAAYSEFHKSADKFASYAEKQTKEKFSAVSLYSWGVSALVLASFTGLVIVLYILQHGNDKVVAEHSRKLETESKRVETLSQFVEAVSAGNYNIELNSNADDNLTTMLVNMRDKLKSNAEDDRKRNWSTSGLAQVGEILRATNISTTELYDNIIKFIVKYTRSNQGGLFILEEEEEGRNKHLELVACYAYERKKYLTKKVDPGDGLVGQCSLEGLRIYLREIPEEYLSITSGLGGSTPKSLLVVPMKVNDAVYGVIELASFNELQEYEIELVEKLAESIASTISNVRINETTRLLLERTQQQAEEMKSQEEEIRQNMEELEATQEEMRRKQDILEEELKQSQQQAHVLKTQEKKLMESQETLQAIVDHLPRAIFWKDKDLCFMGCNKIFAAVAGASSPKELIGKSDFDMAWSAQADAYRSDDMEVMRTRKAKLDIEEVNINSEGEESWVLTSKVPIINDHDEVVAILGMFEDITARKRREADINRKLQERDQLLGELNALKQLMETRKV